MDRKTWKTINKLVDDAMDLHADERPEYVRRQCKNDERLQKEVLEFLTSIEESESEKFLEEPIELIEDLTGVGNFRSGSRPDTTRIGETIENYKILELIEQGGMGSVFLAERTDGAYQKKVAIKLLKRGLDTPSNIARFRRERNILANLDHPNITHLLDGGITPDGLPFLVMDYVAGTPLLTYCRVNKCTVGERLELFKSVCRAVQHAHKNAVIHRDLKPSNVLIADDGTVKILDFGIAEMMEEENGAQPTGQPRSNYNPFTLRYAAPEQLAEKSITTATDIHGLGVLLFELLTGRHPFDTEGKHISEIKHIIEHERPPKPSQKINTLPEVEQNEISSDRKTTPGRLIKKLSGDLDAVMCKALSKDPDDRYSSTEILLDDLERIETHQPLTAREHTLRYKSSKFFHRNKKEISIAALFLLVLAGLFGYHTAQINHEKHIAQQEARISDDVSGFLLELFDTDANRDTLSAASLLEKGMDHLETLEDEPAYANMLSVMGEAYMNFGEYDKAEELLEEAVQKSRSVHGEMSLEHASALFKMGLLQNNSYNWEEAVTVLQKSYTLHAELVGEYHIKTADVLKRLSSALRNTGQLEQAEEYARLVVTIYDDVLEPTHTKRLSASANLAYVLREREKFGEAESLYKKVIANSEDNPGVEAEHLAEYYNNLGYLYRVQEQYDKAIENYRQAIQIKEKSYPEGHPELINTRKNLATSLYFEGRLMEADSLFRKNVSGIRNKYSAQHWRTASALNTLGLFHLENGQSDAAEPFLRESIQINREVLGDDHLWTAYSEGLLAACLLFQQKESELADSLYRHHVALYRKNQQELDVNHRYHLDHLARIHEKNGAPDSLVLAYREMLD